MASTPADAPEKDGFRWQGWLQHSDEAVFLLNRRRKLVFANRVWEKATGLLLKEIRGQACRRRSRDASADKTESILASLAPPLEAWKGSPCQSRRLLPGIGREARWVELAFLPLGSGDNLLGIVGVIKALPDAPTATPQPLPEKWLTLRDRQALKLSDWESDSPELTRVVSQVRFAAGAPGLPVTIIGGPGTGKLALARTLHQLSPWRQRFFACLDCDRLPAQSVAEALFADERHKTARFDVVLLKEPGHLPRELQTRIVHLLEERDEHSPWLMAAFRAHPATHVLSGHLLEALHCRFGTLTITLSSLSERLDDLPRLADRFLQLAAPFLERPPSSLSPEALQTLKHHAWPGNLHELRRVMFQAAERAAGSRIEAAHLPQYLRSAPPPSERTFQLDAILEQVERRMLELALRLSQGNKTKASDLLGIWRPRLLRRIEALQIDAPDKDTAE